MAETDDGEVKMEGKQGGAKGGFECDVVTLHGVEAKIIMKGKQGGAKGGFKYDVVILRGVVEESKREVFRKLAKDIDKESSKWGTLKKTQGDENRLSYKLNYRSNARTALEAIASQVKDILELDVSYKPEEGSMLKTLPGASAQDFHTGKFSLFFEHRFHSSISFSCAYIDTMRRMLLLTFWSSTFAVAV